MIVNKPQFDENELMEGTAIRVTATKWDAVANSYAWNALVVDFAPLEISVVRYNPDKVGEQEEVSIKIDDVTKYGVKIELLKVAS